ncbi:hypothetical protein [Aliikangiella maris]|uniref:Uncharacterized protein n=2 Tax=Aliikangiella maris TaxID=3162458 RepID=A0ABV3MQF8_9GAMM
MQDYQDSAGAIRQTVSLLESSGIQSSVLASTLLAAAIEQYQNCAQDLSLTKQDIQEIVERLVL